VIWRARSNVIVALAILLLTVPALVFVVLGPAIILIIANLSAT
jgi:pilus assembly protein TadC